MEYIRQTRPVIPCRKNGVFVDEERKAAGKK